MVKRTSSGVYTDGRTTIGNGTRGRRGGGRLLTRHVSVVSRTRSKTALASANPRIESFNAGGRGFAIINIRDTGNPTPGTSRLQMKPPTLTEVCVSYAKRTTQSPRRL